MTTATTVPSSDGSTVPRDGTPAISFAEVTKRFAARSSLDAVTALDRVSLDVYPGEFVSLIGPSGCGKSTVLGLASGLARPTSGTITCGTDNLGYVFQDAALMPWRTVRRNVEFMAQLDGMDRATRRRRAEETLELVGLSDFADRYPRTLSGGMKMRTSLARSMVLNPDLFLFDEPFGALDQISRMKLNVELMNLFVERRFASVFVTHSVDEAVFLSTRILVMSPRPGRVAAEFEIPFEYPRDPSLRYEPEFGEVAGAVAAALEAAS